MRVEEHPCAADISSDNAGPDSTRGRPPGAADSPSASDGRRLPMEGRPLLWLGAAFVGGVALDHCYSPAVPGPFHPAIVLAIPVLLITVLLLRPPPMISAPLSLVLLVGLGVLTNRAAAPPFLFPPALEAYMDRPQALFLAEVSAPPDFYPDKTRLPLQLSHVLEQGRSVPLAAGVLLTIDGPPGPSVSWLPGDRLLARIRLKRFHNFNNPGGYDYVRSQAERRLHARAHLANPEAIVKLAPSRGPFPRTVGHWSRSRLDRFRQEALFWIRDHFAGDNGAFYGALLLGYRNLLSRSWQEQLNRAGVTHLLSISGLHLGLISMITFWLTCRALRLLCPALLQRISDQHLALAAALAAGTAYALISGLAIPAWRSLIMLILFFGAITRYRSSDPMTALAAAAMLILLIEPASLWQASFQLSFAAMFGLFCLYPRFKRVQDLALRVLPEGRAYLRVALKPLAEAFFLSLAVNVMVLPVLTYHFKGISVAGLLANTLLVPLVGFLVLPLGLAGLAAFPLSKFAALVILKCGALPLGLCRHLILRLAEPSWAYVWTGSAPVLWMAAYYAGLAVLLSPWPRRRKAGVFALSALLVCCACLVIRASAQDPSGRPLKVTFIDVSQGTSTLIELPSGETMLVDGGGFSDDSYDVGRMVLAPFLWQSGIRRLDYLVLSHDHPDHRNGLRFILSHFDVGCLWESGITERPATSDALTAMASRRGVPVAHIDTIAGEHSIGRCRATVLHPTVEYLRKEWDGSNLNDASLVLQITYGSTHLVLPGDIDQETEEFIFGDRTISGATLLLASHHGSKHSNGALLFDRLKPQAVVFSCGYDNGFGFPAEAVIERCRRLKAPCYRTDLNGAVLALSDGVRWEIRPTLEGD